MIWDILQLLISGIATGAIYALAATGFTLLWQTSQTINFAQGDFVMAPAFLAIAATGAGVPFWLALIAAFVLSALLLGAMFKRLIVDPKLRHGVLPLVIATMALGLTLSESAKGLFGAQARPFPGLDGGFELGELFVAWQDVLVLAVAIGAVTALQLFLARTRTGRCMQATAQNPAVARLLGIPVQRMILLTFVLNAALVALASFLIAPTYLVQYVNGERLGLIAFCAAIVGGFNQIRGAIAGGLLLGVLDNVAANYGPAQYRAAVPLVLLIGFILFRPQGLLGRIEERTV